VLDGQGLAQAADMDVDGALVHVDVAAPDVVEDLVPGVDPVLVGGEEGQQGDLRGPDGHLLAGDADVVADGIELQFQHPDHLLGHVWLLAAQHRLGPGDQLPGGEGLGDIVVGPALQALHQVVLLRFGGEHDHRDLVGELVPAQAAQQLNATGDRHHPVEQYQVGLAVDDQGVAIAGIVGLQAVEPGNFKGDADHVADGRFVIDDQYGLVGHGRGFTGNDGKIQRQFKYFRMTVS